ncbi:uncharacterized protein LOC121656583 isoform X2 [Melanotaenia boesemani]|nr:uncharacterized protein LOC121656583 isoform X2 [Melanotaenia boesemani]XP_041867586.1 uncharacterized protein LOC121656583 isoform X2 [Melanotaenia boesemani]
MDRYPSTSTPRSIRAKGMRVSYREESSTDDENEEPGPSKFSFNTYKDSSQFTELDSSEETLQPEEAASSQQFRRSAHEQNSDEGYKLKDKKKSTPSKNYCYVCGKGVYKIARHLLRHADEEPDIAEAFASRKGSRQRKGMLEKLRNKGNYQHNQEVLKNNSGVLKLRRRTATASKKVKKYFNCPYCRSMFYRVEMWRHVVRCVKKASDSVASGENPLEDSDVAEQIPPAVKKILSTMKVDEILIVVQNDYLLTQLAKSLLEKYGNNPSRCNYVQQKLRVMGRLLLEMHKKSILSFEEALQLKNFSKVVDVVRNMTGFDDKAQSYTKPDLAMKLANSLKNIASIVLSGDEDEMKSNASRFVQLCEKEWDGLASEMTVDSLSGEQVSSPSTIPFTRDVQAFYRYLEKLSTSASEGLKTSDSPQVYNALCRVTLAQASVLSKYAPEVSKMTLKSFQKRGDSIQVLSKHFIRINIRSRTGQSVAVLLTSQLISALTLLIGKREACGVHGDNHFLFAKPDCSVMSHFHGENCIRSFSNLCHAKNPEHLRSAHLQKHVARIFQILNLENDELTHLAKLLGHDIRADQDYYRTPEAAVELAKIAKLLLAMEKGSLEGFTGNSLEEVEIEDQLEPDVEQDNPENPGAKDENEESHLSPQQSDAVEQHGSQLTPFEDALEHMKTCRDKAFLQEKFIDLFKGRGVLTSEAIEPSSFVVEYRGETILCEETKRRSTDTLNGFLFDFWLSGTNWRVDASKESGGLGRLVNDDHINPTCKLKKIFYEGKPHLCLFALRKISPGEEITFDYGSSSYPWRSKETKEEVKMSEADVSAAASSSVDEGAEESSCAESSGEEYVCDEEPCSDDSFSESELQDDAASVLQDDLNGSDGPSCTKKHYCYVCGKSQIKISRHLFRHRKVEPEIAEAFALPQQSKERKRLLMQLRNRGNYKHNLEVLKTGKGKLKMMVKADNVTIKAYSVCIYCKAMCIRKDMWRHLQRCLSKPSHHPSGCKTEFLSLVAMGILDPEHISPGLKKILTDLEEGNISPEVLKDPYLLQLAQYLYYIKEEEKKDTDIIQNLRRMCRLLLVLQEKSIFSFEDATKPQNLNNVVSAIRKLTTISIEIKRCKKLLVTMANIKLVRTLSDDADKVKIQETEAFIKLCTTKWPSNKAPRSKIPSQPAMAFIRDVQLLHQYIESTVASAVKTINMYESPQVYTALLRAVVAYVALLNRNIDVSQVTVQSFQERDESNPQEAATVDQTQPEQFLSKSMVKITVVGERGKKVALALTPDLLAAITLLVEKRKACGVADNHPYLFGKPGASCSATWKGPQSIKAFGIWCGAQGQEGFRCMYFRKHIMRIFQILLLSNDELGQLAQRLGRDIRTEREYYRTPEAAGDVAKILELLSAIEDESLKKFEGKSLEEMDIPDELHPVVEENTEAEIDESELSQAIASSASKRSKKKGKNASSKKQDESKTNDEEQTEKNEAASLERDERSEEAPANAPEETPSCSKEKELHVYFSDDDDDDMNVDFNMDIDTDGDDDDDVRNKDASGSADNIDCDSTKEVDDGHEKEALSPERRSTEEKTITEQPEEEKEAGKDDDDDDEAEQDDWMDVDSDGSSPTPPTKENNLLAALREMKEVKIVIPKLNIENLKASLKISQLSSLSDRQPADDQPTQDAEDQSEVASAPTETETKPSYAKVVHMNCSNCKKSMMKGHTAYQKKGFTDVFCSKICLFERFPHNKAATRTCHCCLKEISQPLDLIMACVDLKGTMKDFCSPACLVSFKSNAPSSQTTKSVSSSLSTQTSLPCSMCNKTCTTMLELTLDEVVHSFCSNDCMEGFCRDNVGVCEGCSSICCKTPLMLKLEEGTRTICGPECLEELKEKIETAQPCAQCHFSQLASDMVIYKTHENTVQLFCSRYCVASYKLMPINQHKLKEPKDRPMLVLSKSDVKCCNCSKDLLKGSSLYQLKSRKEVFCSASCVSERHPHIKMDTKTCHNCLQPISRPQNIILAPVDDSETMKELCSNACLSSVKSKRKMAAANLLQDVCKMCAKHCLCNFKVTVDGEVHRLCSSSCMTDYQNANKLYWSTCDVCSAICPNKRLVVNMEDGSKTICGDECLVKFKQDVKKHQLCPTCRTPHQMSDMTEDKNEESIDFFCSHRCMMVYKAQSPVLLVEVKSPSSDEDVKEVKPSLTSLEFIKEEPVDEEYTQISLTDLSPPETKAEPKEDLEIFSVFSLNEDTKPTEPSLTQTELPSSCSTCKTVLKDGERVYQRKSHKDIFCSTSCLLKFYQMKSVKKTCHFCLQVMTQSQAVLTAEVDNEGTRKDFCSQTCLSSFNYKRMMSTKIPVHPVASHSQCSICSRYCISKHEVILQGVIHKLCSDPCLHRFCNMNNVSICENCGCQCSTQLTLKMEDGHKTLCSAACLAQFRQKTGTQQPCSMCSSSKLISDMVESINSENMVELFCTNSCVMASKIQAISASGASLNCDNCGKMKVPACHLAMPDTSIRNFCSLTCAMAFKETQKDLNAATSSPETHNQTQKDVDKPPKKLQCAQCSRVMKTAPELVHNKEQVHFVCSLVCSQEFKRANNVTGTCEYCKDERIIEMMKRINNKDCCFCSDECNKLFHHELEKKSGKRCRSCAFCLSVSTSVTRNEGSGEEFCSEKCSSKYKMIHSQVVKCDNCSRKRRLKQRLPLLGDVKHFCNLKCLLRFCCKTAHMSSAGSLVPGSADTMQSLPIIANVVSLSSILTQHSYVSASSPQLGPFTDIQTKVVGHASVQTVPKELKNKSMLCVPLVHNKGVSCAVQTVETGVQTVNFREKVRVKTSVLPVPVPVYVPLPMNMYSQFTPNPVALPVPLPVPMFLPERPNEPTAKQKIQTESAEAETEKDERNNREDGQEDRNVTTEQTSASIEEISSYSDGFDADNLLTSNNQEDFVSDASVGSSARQQADKAPPPESDLSIFEDCFPDFPLLPAQDMGQDCLPAPPQSLGKVQTAAEQQPVKAPEENSRRGLMNLTARKHHGLNNHSGVKAWWRWIQWRGSQTDLTFSSPAGKLKPDILGCTSAELNNGLCLFIGEVQQQQEEPLSPDRLFYLCLSIQQFLLKNGRIENIFSDLIYSNFSAEFTRIMKQLKPSVSASGYVPSCVEEEFLWECKQLGAYSPITLLNTLMFFCCKYFGFTSVEQHRQLSFARLTTTNRGNAKTAVLRFYPPTSTNEEEPDNEGVPAKKLKLNELENNFLEISENTQNPLRCPVRLYEFYVSRCSELVNRCSSFFYLRPDRRCNPSSPLWFSPTPLDDATMEAMIIRFLAVRELQEEDGGEM